MQRSFYKSTTALVMSLSLLNPVMAQAQDDPVIDCTPKALLDNLPCLDVETGKLVLPVPAEEGAVAPDDAPLSAEAQAKIDAAALGAALDAAKAAKAEATAATDAEAALAAQAAAEAEAAAAADAALAAETEATATAEAAAEAEAAAAAKADTAAGDEILAPCPALDPSIKCDPSAEDLAAALAAKVPVVAVETEAAKAAETPATAESGEVRTLTKKDIRSSTEEFGTAIDATPKVKGNGQSDLEKAGLLLLGALVVGAIINNNEKVVSNTGDRIVVQDENGDYHIYKDDDVLLMQPGATVRTETFSDGSSRSTVQRADGTQIVTIRDASGRVQRRLLIGVDGRESTLIDDTVVVDPVDITTLPRADANDYTYADTADLAALRLALTADEGQTAGRTFSLRQIREIRQVRELAREININTLTFETGSAAIRPAQAENLQQLGDLMVQMIAENPLEVFLIEGHTDAVGDPAYNLALSDRRAETVALALTEYFAVPPENLIVQGYGEQFLKVKTLEAERRNRRVAIRRITTLLN